MHTLIKALLLTLPTSLVVIGCVAEPELSGQATSSEDGQKQDAGVTETKEALGSTVIYDGPGYANFHQCNGMHCCPNGWAMVGIHVGDNVFSCRQVMSNPANEVCFINQASGNQRDGMHACPGGSIPQYMKGAHVGTNTFTCCYDGAGQSTGQEQINYNTTDGYMHTCIYTNEEAMTGLHVGLNELLCRQWFGIAP